MPGIDKTENEIRIRQVDPAKFDRFTYQTLGGGVSLVLGWKNGKSETQSVRFDNKKFDKTQAREWIKKHPQYHMSEEEDMDPKYFFAEVPKDLSWFEACREGAWDYVHPNGKTEKVKINERTIDNFIRNFKENVRGLVLPGTNNPTLPIDYEHGKDPKYGKDAAGWIGDLEKRDKTLSDGRVVKSLWIKPAEYTPDAQDAVKNGVKRYFSVTFNDWINPETKKFYKDVLFGGALTNEPFVKGLTPITLTELVDEPKKFKKENNMLEKIKKFLAANDIKFAEDVSDDIVMSEAHKYLVTLTEAFEEKSKEVEEFEKKFAEMEAVEMAEQEKKILSIAKGKLSPAEQKDEKGIYRKLMSEKRYADVAALLEMLPVKFKEETKSEDEDEDEDDMEMAEWDDIPGEKKDEMVKKAMAVSKKNYAEAAKDVEEEHMKKLAEKRRKK